MVGAHAQLARSDQHIIRPQTRQDALQTIEELLIDLIRSTEL